MDLKRLPPCGSDHFPMYIAMEYRPLVNNGDTPEPLSPDEDEEVDEKIAEGKAHAGKG
ncbi:MAG: hypothetical protein IPI91_20855 [Flavobacteriales bacterium]|nr:hypothetical protein [Flavobacteriales bacterium]